MPVCSAHLSVGWRDTAAQPQSTCRMVKRATRASTTLVVDNGAYHIKYGLEKSRDPILSMPNGVFRSNIDKRTYIADELDDDCMDHSGLVYRLPFERGILNNWDVQKAVWDRLFKIIDPRSTSLLITEPCFNLPNVQDAYDQMMFEEYEFHSYCRLPASLIVGMNQESEATLVVDSGYSATYIVPVLNDEVQWSSVRRLDIGGKLLTNYLKELISYRQIYMMDQTFVVNTVKESTCYVSPSLSSFTSDQQTCKDYPRKRNPLVKEFVLPDFATGSTNRFGYVKDPEDPEQAELLRNVGEDQVLAMANERFSVPEVLFNPSMIGLDQVGIAEAIKESIDSLPEELQGLFWANILCTGGNFKFSGMETRLETELKQLMPDHFHLNLTVPEDPINHALLSAKSILPQLSERFVTRKEYLEGGSQFCRQTFASSTIPQIWTGAPVSTFKEDEEEVIPFGTRPKKEDKSKKKGKRRASDMAEAAFKPW